MSTGGEVSRCELAEDSHYECDGDFIGGDGGPLVCDVHRAEQMGFDLEFPAHNASMAANSKPKR